MAGHVGGVDGTGGRPDQQVGTHVTLGEGLEHPTWTAPRLPPPERTKAVVTVSSSHRGGRRKRGGQAGQGDGGDEKPEVTQRHVVEAGDDEEVDDDPGQPCGHQVAAEAGSQGDDETGDDLDDPDRVHQLMRGPGRLADDERGEVAVPVDEDVEELVQAEQDRRHREADPQQPEGLVGGIVALGRGRAPGGGGSGCERAGHFGACLHL